LKKEKKRKEKELAKLLSNEAKRSSIDLSCKKEEPEVNDAKQLKSVEPSGYNSVSEIGRVDTKPVPPEGTSGAPKIRIKIKNRMLSKSYRIYEGDPPLHFLGCSFILNIRHSMIFFELYLLLVLYSGFRAM